MRLLSLMVLLMILLLLPTAELVITISGLYQHRKRDFLSTIRPIPEVKKPKPIIGRKKHAAEVLTASQTEKTNEKRGKAMEIKIHCNGEHLHYVECFSG